MRWIGLPGMDGTATLFAPLARLVELEGLRYPNRPLTYEQLEAWVRDRLPSEPFGLVAESFSGPLGLRIAADPPPPLRALLLVATFARSPVPLPPAAHLWSRPVLALPLPRWAIRAVLTGSEADRDLVRAVQDALGEVHAATLAARAEAIRTVDVRALRSRVPALHLVARQDRLVRPRHAAELAVEVRHVEGPHLLCQTRPDLVAKAMRSLAT